MRTIDRLAVDEIGIPGIVLMERAGLAATSEILTWFPNQQRVAVICGAGNNGGDGFVVARHLAATGRDVEVLLVEAASKIRRESRTNLTILEHLGIPVRRVNATEWSSVLNGVDLVVDAILGTGASGAPRPNVELAINAMRDSLVPVVALDVPSGIDSTTGVVEGSAVNADLTIAFHGPKVGVAIAPGRFHAGRVKAVDIGIPARLDDGIHQGLVTHEVLALLPPRARDGNKYRSGSVLCIGGSTGMTGAITLAARATLRAGAGIAWAVVPEPVAAVLDAATPEVQVRPAISDATGLLTVAAAEGLEPLVERAGALLFGPGVGESDQVRALARWAVRHAGALVLDAQGLTAFAGDIGALSVREDRPTILTPHEGELAALIGKPAEWVRANRLDAVRDAALQSRAVVLLKGEDSITCLPGGDFLVSRNNVAQATAGSGDVLAGTCAALLARGVEPSLAAACAATACGRAAELAAVQLSPTGVVASDLIDRLPIALQPHALDHGA
jgi:NAD(P)H-hydrate epimerase